jgi:hypothetical protein
MLHPISMHDVVESMIKLYAFHGNQMCVASIGHC